MPIRSVLCVMRVLAGLALPASPAAALVIAFDASQPGFPDPQTAVGHMELGLSLADLIASDTGGALVPLGVPVSAPVTLTDSSGAVDSVTYTLDPKFSTSSEQLLLQVELLAGNPAKLELTIFDSAGWRGCIADPATCERRAVHVSVPGGFGPGVAVGTLFDSDLPNHQVDVLVPEPGSGLLLAALAGFGCARRWRGRARA
jgi:hypothetical protein